MNLIKDTKTGMLNVKLIIKNRKKRRDARTQRQLKIINRKLNTETRKHRELK